MIPNVLQMEIQDLPVLKVQWLDYWVIIAPQPLLRLPAEWVFLCSEPDWVF